MTAAYNIKLQFAAYRTILAKAILALVALSRIVNYDCKVCCKLKRAFTIVKQFKYRPKRNDDRKTFILQVTYRCFLRRNPNLMDVTRIQTEGPIPI